MKTCFNSWPKRKMESRGYQVLDLDTGKVTACKDRHEAAYAAHALVSQVHSAVNRRGILGGRFMVFWADEEAVWPEGLHHAGSKWTWAPGARKKGGR